VNKETPQGEKVYQLDFEGCRVRFPGFEQPLSLVVVDGLGEQPLLLLTALEIKRSQRSLWRVVESYLAAGRVEKTIRFIKQSYQLDDIRLVTYERLRNLAVLVMVTAFFA
jgi:hypothetical protein